MKRVAVGYHGFWPQFRPDHFLERHPYLAARYELVPSERPDVVFYAEHAGADPAPPPAHDHVRVFYTAEPQAPDLDAYDFALSFERLDDPRHFRLPNYLPRLHVNGLRLEDLIVDGPVGPRPPKFAAFVARRPNELRELFVETLRQLGPVDAPAGTLQNVPPIGPTVADKLAFLSGYRFTVAFENGSQPGYVTEKLVEAKLARSVPIYWGAPDVELDFDPESFVSRHDFEDIHAFVDRILELERDADAYDAVRGRSLLWGNRVPLGLSDERVLGFFDTIFEPVARPIRTRVPAPASELVDAPPDFIGVGVQKAGTTRWFKLIAEHPAVYCPDPWRKELDVFVDHEETRPALFDPREYAKLFARPEGMIAGEWTPSYMLRDWVPPLIVRAAPGAKLLAILRDPVDRYRSGITHSAFRWGMLNDGWLRMHLEMGFYARQLQRLYEWFPREQVLVLQFERCAAQPERELARTYEFLGLDPAFVPEGLREHVHRTSVEKLPLPASSRASLVAAYREDVLELAGLVPELDLSLWPSFAELAAAAA